MEFRFFLPFGLFFMGAIALHAAPVPGNPAGPKAPAGAMDQKAIHEIYSEGDFEGVIEQIEAFTSAHKSYSHSDSIFIAKHLAVIYTANPATREKGKNYMFRLLGLMPSAKIVDMFVSDEIDHIFEKVREEYIVRRRSLGYDAPSELESNRFAANKLSLNPDSVSGKRDPSPKPAEQAKPRSSHAATYWIAGGVSLAAVAGLTLYAVMPRKPQDKTYVLPK